jgi:hypothetical protein
VRELEDGSVQAAGPTPALRVVRTRDHAVHELEGSGTDARTAVCRPNAAGADNRTQEHKLVYMRVLLGHGQSGIETVCHASGGMGWKGS